MMKKIQDAGFHIAEVPVHHYHRSFGKSQFFNFPRLFRTAVGVAGLWVDLVVLGKHRRAAPRPAGCAGNAGRAGEARLQRRRR